MKSKLFIPNKIIVGFQNRSGTFTGKLAYVIYEDEKGKLRKQDSWDNWRDKDIPFIELDNNPQSGFVFNKGVQRSGDYFGSGRSVIRVYDSRDFEFEISVDNLIGILMNSDVSKRDIVEECVFAWSGKDLILLPINSEEYKQSLVYTKKQTKKISAKELQKGYVYSLKKSDNKLMYMGYFLWNEYSQYPIIKELKSSKKRHVFYDINHKNFSTPVMTLLAECILEEPSSDYAKAFNKMEALVNITGYEMGFKKINEDNLFNKKGHYARLKSNFVKIDKNYAYILNAQSYLKDIDLVAENEIGFYVYNYLNGSIVQNERDYYFYNNVETEKLREKIFNCSYSQKMDKYHGKRVMNKKDFTKRLMELNFKEIYNKKEVKN